MTPEPDQTDLFNSTPDGDLIAQRLAEFDRDFPIPYLNLPF